ncbi:hypothetical protein GW17_00053646 [Ensete ventricosum]|nr:hypothetical protein GW17_00053646 [Ensete ventricosum]
MIVQRTFVGPSTSAFKGSSVNGSSLILSSRYLTMKPKGNLVTELIGDLAGTLETTTELLRLLVGGHDPPFSLSWDLIGSSQGDLPKGVGNTLRDRRKKTVRLTARMPEATELGRKISTVESQVSDGCTTTTQDFGWLSTAELPRLGD